MYLAAGAWQSAHLLLAPHFDPFTGRTRIPLEAIECLCLLMAAWFKLKQTASLARGTAWLRADLEHLAALDPETRGLVAHALALQEVRTGRYDEARAMLARISPEERERITPWTRARVALLEGRIEAETGCQQEAERHGLEAARSAGLAGCETLRGDAMALLAIVARRRGHLEAANALYAQAATHYWQAGNASGHATVLLNRAWALGLIGLLPDSRRLFQEALTLAMSLERAPTALRAKLGLGWIAVRGGDLPAARSRLLGVWREARRLRMPREEGLALEYLAEVYTLAGELAKADWSVSGAERMAARLGSGGDVALEAGLRRAMLHLARGGLAEAVAKANAVVAEAMRLDMPWEQAQALRIIGMAAFREGLLEQAAEAFERARGLLGDMGERLELGVIEAWIAGIAHLRAAGGARTGLSAEVAANRSQRVSRSATSTMPEPQLALPGGKGGGHLPARGFWLSHPLLGPWSWLRDKGAPQSGAEEHAFERGPAAVVPGVSRANLRPLWAELGLVTRTPELVETLRLAETYAPGRIPVLILGETGTGKDLLAQGLARLAGRKGSLVPVNCAAAQKELFVAELFGARRGAYTGAVERRRGLIEEAAEGTLFFDEIADLQPEAQGFLLRFLDSGEVRPLGETRSRRIETRVIAATCRDLRSMVREGRFRPDLYARLAGLVLRVPPLRERPEDLDLLIEMLWRRDGGALSQCRAVFTPRLLEDLKARDWGGNVRELRHAVSRALLYCRTHGARATRAEPEQWLRGLGAAAATPAAVAGVIADAGRAGDPTTSQPRRQARGDWSEERLRAALDAAHGRIAVAAKRLGLSRSHAYRLYKELRERER